MDDKIRPVHQAVAKTICSTKHEPYLEIVLPRPYENTRLYDPEFVIRYNLYCKYSDTDLWLYEYETVNMRQCKTLDGMKEHTKHTICPACSYGIINETYINNYGKELNEPRLICKCSKCNYSWLTKPDFLK